MVIPPPAANPAAAGHQPLPSPTPVATPVPASTPAAMEFGSPSRRSWADEVEEADSLPHSSSPPLNANAEPFVPGSSPAVSWFSRGERLCFSDSEASLGSAAPSPANVAEVGEIRERRRRPRRRRRHRRRAAQDASAHQAATASPPPMARLRSVAVHPARLSAEPDDDGFREVHSRRRWRRRPSPTLARPVPPDLVGLCFNCLRDDHIRANCRFPPRCRTCRQEGHRARFCPMATFVTGAKRGRSPGIARRAPARRRRSPERWRPPRDDTVSARSVSTGRSPSVPVAVRLPAL